MSATNAPASALIADFVLARRETALSEHDLHLGKRAFVDTLAGALAARNNPATALMADYARSLTAPGSDPGTASLWVTGERLSPEAAALANGAIGHVLDFDDVTSPIRGHPSVVIWPALLALAETEQLGFLDMLRGFATGLEVIAKLGRAVAIDHVAKGWHSTNTLGGIAAAVACSQMLGLNHGQITSAIGLAVAQAGGLRANFGTMAKCFQAGQAAASALRAVALARRGFTGSDQALDGSVGFTNVYCQGETLTEYVAALGESPLETVASGLDVKRYPNCYATHRTIQAILELRRQHSLTLADVESASVVTSRRAQVPLIYSRPKTGLEGKFSLQYAVTAALNDGELTLSTFTDEMVLRPEIQDFLPKVQTSEDDGSPLPRWAKVRLRLRNQTELTHRVETLKGSNADPLSDDEIIDKFVSCCRYAGYDSRVETYAAAILASVDLSTSARALTDALHSR